MIPMLCRVMLLAVLTVVVTLAGCTGGDDPAAPTVSVGETALPNLTQAPPPTHTPAHAAAPTRTPAPTVVPSAARELAPSEIYARVSPSVVSIQSRDGTLSLGTGFLIEGGYVVTNLHVVWPPFGEKSVVFPDGTRLNVPVAAWDPMSDIALLGPVNVAVPPLELQDGENLAVGSELFLLGYPGENDPSPEPAIVSGLLSQIREWEPMGITYFQTDAAVAGGQSGGALVNARGEVIGISGLRFSDANYALVASAADMKPIVQQLALGQDPSGISNREISLEGRDDSFSGSLRNPWDTRTFVLSAPSTFELEVDSPGPVRFRVTDANGNVILDGGNDSGGVAHGSGEPLSAGILLLTLETPSRSAGEPVEFRLTSNVPMFPQNDPDDGRTIKASGSSLTGSIDHFQDADWYPIHLEEGETVRILASSVNVDTVLLVDSPNLRINQVAYDEDSGGGLFETDSELVFRAPKAGEYYIVVKDFDGQSLGGYFLLVEQAPAASEPVPIPPVPEEVETPHGRMLVYESPLSDLSIEVPADWFPVWPDGEDSYIAFQASSADGDAALIIFEFDLVAEGDFQTLEELADSLQARLLGEAFEARRENIVASSGDPAVVLHLQQQDEPGEACLLTSIRDERYVIFVAYLSKDGESLKSLAEYSFATLNSSGDGQAVRLTDRQALAALYNATDGQNWQHNDGWLSDQPIGEWYGVVTSPNGRVVELHLDGNRLSGIIPAELGSLKFLTWLLLGGNDLTGDIPPELGSLANLKRLQIDSNQLTGGIPEELGSLTNLELLVVSFNQLKGEIPAELGNLTNLEILRLGSNQLTGEIPPEVGNLMNLRTLGLRNNELTGQIPPELGNLTRLEEIGLSDNQLTGEIPTELGNLTSLGNILFGRNQLTGKIPQELGNLLNLKSLYLDENELTGKIPPELGSLTNLFILRLDDNRFTGEIPVELSGLPNLQYLYLYRNELTGRIPPELGNLRNLVTLLLGDNQLTGDIPSELGRLSNLTELVLSGNALTGCAPTEWRAIKDVEMDLPYCDETPADGATGLDPATDAAERVTLALLYNSTDGQNWENDDGWLSDRPIGEWYGVFTNANGRAVGLHLKGNQLSGVIPPELGSLSDLELLNLSDNRLGGAIPVELGNLKSLRSLYLNQNDLTWDIPPVLGDLARLEILHLQFNNLTGEIPPELSNLARLRELDLGVNDLSGEIPPELGALGNLTSLWLGWNDLSGRIPPELANLGRLTRLWLNNSRLEGCLPDNLASQLDDQSNVEHLQICGERPSETSEQADVQSRRIDLREYADRYAGGPGAIYVGDIKQLVGLAPTVDQGDFDGSVPSGALARHLWIYESPLYQDLLEKAKLTDPTPMTYDGPTITVRHVCINRALLPCRLMETYLAPNLKERTNGKLEFVTSSFPELGLTGPDTLSLVTDGTLDSATVDGGYAGFELPPIEIQNLWGIYSSHEQEFEATQVIIKDIEELVLAETGGVVMNHNWYAGNDRFFFCREKIDTLDGFVDKKTLSYSPALSDWVNGMGARANFLAFAEVYTAMERGVLDCAAAGAHVGYSQRWYEVTDYLIGPLSSFSSNNNVINAEKWASIPEDLQKILLEEAAKSELEALRIAAIQNEIGLFKNTTERWAGQDAMEFVPFSDEMNYRSKTVLMQQVVPRWVNRVGGTEHPIIADTFNKKVGPIVGLRIEADWTVVKVPPADATETSE